MRLGRASMVSTTQAQVVYFHKYTNQRSTNPSEDVRVELPLNRVTARGFFSVFKTHDRPSLEIDLRAPRLVQSYGIGGDVRLLSKSTVRVEAFRSQTSFSQDAVVEGTSLRQVLNQTNDGFALSARHVLTPLTTAVVRGEWLADSFEYEPVRDSQSVRLMSGLEFGRFALISGAAFVGYRRFMPELATIPEFTGVVASIDLSSVIRGATRLSVSAARDLAYSFSNLQPYYLQTNASVAVTRRLGTKWEIVATAGWQQLSYRGGLGSAEVDTTSASSPSSVVAPDANRMTSVEKGISSGFGLGYRLARGVRVGIDGKRLYRFSSVAQRDYEAWQAGCSVSYGF